MRTLRVMGVTRMPRSQVLMRVNRIICEKTLALHFRIELATRIVAISLLYPFRKVLIYWKQKVTKIGSC